MNYQLTTTPLLTACDCLVLGVFNDTKQTDIATKLDKQHQDLIARLITKLTNSGDLVWQTEIDGHRLLIIHCGDASSYTTDVLSTFITAIMSSLLKQNIKSATLCLPQLTQNTPDEQLQQMVLQLDSQCYQFLDFKTQNKKPHCIESMQIYLPGAQQETINITSKLSNGINLTRNLANLPANICTPTYLAKQAQELAAKHKTLKTKILNRDELLKLGMGAFLAVAQGSNEPPQFIEVNYQGAGDAQPIVLIGKGITFDSGGISIKPANGMEEMKYDMTGAACILGTLKACALQNLPINVVGLMACAENMPSGTAVKPGDIVTSLSGQTIEITNTDAEGRLVLADALTYAERFNPQFVIDIATLTGAIIIALGHEYSGLMTQDDALADLILTAAKQSQDKTWRLPLDDAYQEIMDSPIADMLNASTDRSASSITAACFLSRFSKKFRWAHLDIAGTAWIPGKNRQATGRVVPLLVQILRQVAYAN
ncbi:leucyl aminopeptidase [bacterium]|nr:leucyl aminopeptidase [bacterium]